MTDIASLGIRVTTDGVKEAESQLDKLGNTGEKTARQTQQLAPAMGSASKATSLLGSAMRTLGPLIAAAFSVYTVRRIASLADEFTSMNARIGLVTKSLAEQQATQERLFRLSQQLGSELGSTTDLYTKLAQSSDRLKGNQTELLRVTELIGKAMVVSGAGTAEAAAAQRQLAQAMASGVLRGDEFNSVMENSPRLARAIAEGLEVSIGQLRKMAEEGELTADRVTSALLRSGRSIDAEFERMPLTIGRAMQKVENAFAQLVGKTDEATEGSRALAGAIEGLANSLGDPQTIAAFQQFATGLANVAASAFQAVGALREYYAENARKGDVSLINRRNDLESEMFRRQRGDTGLFGGANDPIGKLLGLGGTNEEKLAGIRREIAQIDRLLDERAAKSAADARRHPADVERAGLMFNPNGYGPIDIGGGGKKKGRKPREPSDRDTGVTLLARIREQIALGEVEIAQGEKLSESDRLRAQMQTLLADSKSKVSAGTRQLLEASLQELDAQEQYKEIAETNALIDAEAAEQQSALAQARQAHADAIAAQLDAMQFEFDLIGKTNVQRAQMIALRHANVSATSAEGQAILEMATKLELAHEQEARLNDVKFAAEDMFASFIDGSKSAGDAFEDFAKSLQRIAARMLAEKAVQWLFSLFSGGMGGGAPSSSFASGFGNNTGWLFDYGGPRASGGSVSGSKLYEVGEGGRPELFQQNGRTYLIPGSDGMVVPAASSLAGMYAPVPRGASGGDVTLIVENNGDPMRARTEESQGPGGERLIKLILDRAEDRVAGSIANMGKVGKSIKSRFGVNEAGVSRG